MKAGLLHDYYENFSTQDKKYYFCVEGSTQGEIESMRGEIEMIIGKLRNSQKLKFQFLVQGTFRDDI